MFYPHETHASLGKCVYAVKKIEDSLEVDSTLERFEELLIKPENYTRIFR